MGETDGASFYKPTFAERFWRRLGFRFHLGEEPEGCDVLEGWMRTDISLRFGWSDRLRLLLTGDLRVTLIVHMDTPSPAICMSRVDWRIRAPRQRTYPRLRGGYGRTRRTLMAWSLGNHMAAGEVAALVDSHFNKNYGPEVERQFSRDQALALVHAAIWGVAVRAGSTAGAYAFIALTDALGFKGWTFDQEEADALQRFRVEKAEAARALRMHSATPPTTPPTGGRETEAVP